MGKARVSIQVVEPQVAVTYAVPVAAIDYISLVTVADLDNTGRYQYKSEFVAVLDSKVIDFAKALAHSVEAQDSSNLQVEKAVGDSVEMTDSFSKLITYIRAFADSLDISEFVAIETFRIITDAVVPSDNIAKTFERTIPDGVAMNDSADIGDGLLVAVVKTIMNMAFASDAAQLDIGKSLTDETTQDDTSFFHLERPITSAFELAETLNFATELLRTDAFSIEDAIAVAFSKEILGDETSPFDFVSKDPGKGLSDEAFTEDEGSLLAQGYCDISYFAADYVGESRSFT